MDFISSPFALADPVPLTVAIFITTSFTLATVYSRLGGSMLWHGRAAIVIGVIACIRHQHGGLLHIPGTCRASLGTESTVNTKILIFHHDPLRLWQTGRHVQSLFQVLGRR